jgi:hypothetical protein
MVVFEKMQAFFRYLQPAAAHSLRSHVCGLRCEKSDAHVVSFSDFIVSSLRDELCEASYYAGLSIILPSSKNSMVAAPVSI